MQLKAGNDLTDKLQELEFCARNYDM